MHLSQTKTMVQPCTPSLHIIPVPPVFTSSTESKGIQLDIAVLSAEAVSARKRRGGTMTGS